MFIFNSIKHIAVTSSCFSDVYVTLVLAKNI